MELRTSWEEKGFIKGKSEDEAKGKIEGKQDAIYKFLSRRFGIDATEVYAEVLKLNDLAVLDNLLMELFAANSPEEASQ